MVFLQELQVGKCIFGAQACYVVVSMLRWEADAVEVCCDLLFGVFGRHDGSLVAGRC